ncbi:MAG: hypothetical protein R3B48_13960 [Kofleriaceae bacterium]
MKRTWMLVGLSCLMLALTSSCKKEGSPGVAALVSADIAKDLGPELLAFAEALPSETQGFGYLQLGKPLSEFPEGMFAVYRGMFDDITEMVVRRWGVDVTKIRGLGLMVIQDLPVAFVSLPDGSKAPPLPAGAPVALGKVGAFTVVGPPPAVKALTEAAAQHKPLHKAQPLWLKDALTRAAGSFVFFSGDFAKFMIAHPPKRPLPSEIANVQTITTAVSRGGFVAAATCKPGTAEAQRKIIEDALAKAKPLALMAARAKLRDLPLVASMATHYANALFGSIKVDAQGDSVSVGLHWSLPELPAELPAPPLTQRAIAKEEWLVAQLNLVSPMLEMMVAFTDVLEVKLDRAAMVKELKDELTKLLGVRGLDPHAVTISAGSDSLYVSLAAEGAQVEQGPTGIPLAVLATPWGLAGTEAKDGPLLEEHLASPPPALELVASSKFADAKDAMLRLFVDATKMPPKLANGMPPLKDLSLAMTGSVIAAEVTAQPGQGAMIAGLITEFVSKLQRDAEEPYKRRAQASVPEELKAIMQYHQAKQFAELFTAKVDGDHLHFSYTYPVVSARVMGAAALVGVAAAVAVPAMMPRRPPPVPDHARGSFDPTGDQDDPPAQDAIEDE